jgi:hypothetical protein
MKNLLKNIPQSLPDELFETLVKTDTIHIERIVSTGPHLPRKRLVRSGHEIRITLTMYAE